MAVSIEEKQKSLYAALIRYSSDARCLRERAVDHLVLIALQDTAEDTSIRAGHLRKIIGKGVGTDGLRIEVVQESLTRLISSNLCETIEVKNKPHFYISTAGKKELGKLSDVSDQIMQPCIDRMLLDYEFNGNKSDVIQVCKRFIVSCFVEYGHQMAQCVIGDTKHKNISDLINAQRTFAKSINGLVFSDDENESLYFRCVRFLKSNDKKDIEVKLLLTQAYYLAKILELDDKDFDPLTESTFKGSIIYIDSNVVFDAMFDQENINLFEDILAIADRLEIELCVTQATIEEINRVLINKVKTFGKIVQDLPSALYKDNRDYILNGFLKYCSENTEATPKDFLASLGDIRDELEKKGIKYKGLDLIEDFRAEELKNISKVVCDEAKKSRESGKSVNVADHDAAHLLLVKKNRESNVKSWFLTKDSTLDGVSNKLSSKRTLIFSLSSFLQCISPFVQGKQSDTLYQLFERVLENDSAVAGVGNLFEVSELQIISEYHQDIMASEPEQLHFAFEFVKSSYLNGNNITRENQHKVHLQIKQFLRSSEDEQKNAMRDEMARKHKLAFDAQLALVEKEGNEVKLLSENKELEDKLLISSVQQKKGHRDKLFLRIPLFILGLLLSFVPWLYDDLILKAAIHLNLISSTIFNIDSKIIFRCIGSITFVALSSPICFWFNKEVRVWLLSFVFMLSIYFSKTITSNSLSTLSAYIGISIFLAGIYSWVIRRK
jgi:hypothetical protein